MAVYGRNYRRYTGETTPAWSRFLILPRYAYETVFKSKLFLIFYALCFLVPFIGLLYIYLCNNLNVLSFLQVPTSELQEFFTIGKTFFYRGMWIQGAASFILVFLVGPTVVSPDLRNNGLALYLSRPFSRGEYVLGKMSVLLILLSSITWVPGLLLFGFQAAMNPKWVVPNLGLVFAILVGSWTWILFLSLLTLTISAWVKWAPVARIAMIVLFFVSIGFANAINEILDTWWGTLISAWYPMASIWDSLFGMPPGDELPPPLASWMALIFGSAICLWLLSRRIRAYEVVR
jgi:ABC-2 type transport system permease protein